MSKRQKSASAKAANGVAGGVVGVGGGLNAAWSRMFYMVNEATRAALSPGFGASSEPSSDGEGQEEEDGEEVRGGAGSHDDDDDVSQDGAEEDDDEDGDSGDGTDDNDGSCSDGDEGGGSDGGNSPKRARGGSSGGDAAPKSGGFHGYPCPGCGAGVGFNAKKCRECGQLCTYRAPSGGGGGSERSRGSRRKAPSRSGSPRKPPQSPKARKRPRSSSTSSPRRSKSDGAETPGMLGEGPRGAPLSPLSVPRPRLSGAGLAAQEANRDAFLRNADGDPILITTDFEALRVARLQAAEVATEAATAAAALGSSSGPSTAAAPEQSSSSFSSSASSTGGGGSQVVERTPSSRMHPLAKGATRGLRGQRRGGVLGTAWEPPAIGPDTCEGMRLPPPAEPHPEILSPLLAAPVGRAGLRAHITMLRTESVLRVARPLLSRIMAHTLNRGLFNEPVDPDNLSLPDYRRIVNVPMDLGTVKGKLLSMQYDEMEPFISDVRRCFANARLYNPCSNHVHKAAAAMSDEFEDELQKLAKKLSRDEKRRTEHACSLCQGMECGLCGEKCLKLEPVMLVCSGACNQRIKRGANFFITRDGGRLWCAKCHTGLSSVLPPLSNSGDPDLDLADPTFTPQLFYKRDLLRRCYDEDIPEPWVQCDACQGWFHQACALYNRFYEQGLPGAGGGCGETDGAVFACPLCRLGPDACTLPLPWLHRARETFYGAFKLDDTNPPGAGAAPGAAGAAGAPVHSGAAAGGALPASADGAAKFGAPAVMSCAQLSAGGGAAARQSLSSSSFSASSSPTVAETAA